ncbi:HipA N-terminal domain-containing protein [Paucibacter sp. R3-3]|uniref:HipA N-terminal domain-containing protein n=1 Tax=Roseateles agri TaxID=3098619 RepID=A0ABU5DN10_9BURK|nr:HipA N-terminal domain-containing protein [Paucibacter sp. R3-3]
MRLSLSLPFTPSNAPHRGHKVRAYSEYLLPDSTDIRDRLARRFNIGSTGAFELLAEIGRDCVGALEVLPDGSDSSSIYTLAAEPLSEARIAKVLGGATTPNAMVCGFDDDDLRISIAGAQENRPAAAGRTVVLSSRATPTTSISKLPQGLIGARRSTCATRSRTSGCASRS